MRNIKLTVTYKGTAFAGWQVQSSQRTIQGVIQEAIRKLTSCEVEIVGAGRTDAGVHALGQVANFKIDSPLPTERFLPGLNFHLPEDIRILAATEVAESFHARFDATYRRYRYLLSPINSALYKEFRWETGHEIQYGRLQEAASILKGKLDCSAFCVTASQKESNICDIQHARWYRIGELYLFEIRADRFLHHMVRSLVGCMHNLALERHDTNPLNLTLERFANMLGSPKGERAVFTAPAHGLYLVAVGYGTEGAAHEVFHRHRES